MFPAAALAVLLISIVATGLTRRYALRSSLLDVPNERSSHLAPTPRGGGLGVVIALSAGLVYLWFTGALSTQLTSVWLSCGVLLAGVGWWDDHHDLPRSLRLMVQFAAACWIWYGLGGASSLTLGSLVWGSPVLVPVTVILGVIWVTNLYNFMDGSDGLAASQAVFSASAAGILLYVNGDRDLAHAHFILALACLGFLVWNWPPARIFLGDVGSYAIGISLAILAVTGEVSARLPGLIWLILLGPFLVDATATLILRMAKRERWYAAHRGHVYQLLIQAGWSHRRVALTYLALNVTVGMPLAWIANRFPNHALAAALAAIGLISLSWLALRGRTIKKLGLS